MWSPIISKKSPISPFLVKNDGFLIFNFFGIAIRYKFILIYTYQNANYLTPDYRISDDPLLDYFYTHTPLAHPDRLPVITKIPRSKGKGAVTCFAVEEGFCAGYYDVVFSEDFTFNFPLNLQDPGNTLFRLVFSFSTQFSGYGSPLPQHAYKTNFYSINFVREGFLPKNKPYRSVEFIFSKAWLERNYGTGSGKVFKLIKLLTTKKDPTFLSEIIEKSGYAIAENIGENLVRTNINFLQVKAQVFTLLDIFFQKTLHRSQRSLRKNQALHYRVVKELEKDLSKYYRDELPNIGTLAKEYNIGSSTLKRQFKLIFNKSIYNYYLEQKMALGMAMLEEKNASVSEVAYRLGYQKINSFSKIFKKHYGVLPSEF